MLHFAGFFAFGLPFALPSISTPVGMVVWTVLIITGISVLVAVLHLLYFILCGLVFVHLWIKGMIEERNKRENR
jgi:predicted tellurium resistance membrane protein TerC